jgi:hypothetical protein
VVEEKIVDPIPEEVRKLKTVMMEEVGITTASKKSLLDFSYCPDGYACCEEYDESAEKGND